MECRCYDDKYFFSVIKGKSHYQRPCFSYSHYLTPITFASLNFSYQLKTQDPSWIIYSDCEIEKKNWLPRGRSTMAQIDLLMPKLSLNDKTTFFLQ